MESTVSAESPAALNEPPLRAPGDPEGAEIRYLQAALRRLDRRDWWILGSAVLVTVLLCAAIVVVSLPVLLGDRDVDLRLDLSLSLRALVAMVLLFDIYTLYQHLLIKRLQKRLAAQMSEAMVLEARARHYREMAMLDPLTGLYNRRFVEQHLEVECSRAERNGQVLTVMCLDLDRFKDINDDYGHAAGDQVLRYFAERLRAATRGSDLCIRMGGDEFLLLLPKCTAEQTAHVLERLSNLEVRPDGKPIPISFSAGWAEYRGQESCQNLLERADRSLYLDKRNRSVQQQLERNRDALERERSRASRVQTMGEVAGGVVHDFTNLLTIIKGHTELLGERLGGEPAAGHHIREIAQAADRAHHLTRRILDFSRKKDLSPEVLDLNGLLGGLEGFLPSLLGGTVRLKMSLSADLWPVWADRLQLEQAVLNLAVNARDAMPAGGMVSLATSNIVLDEEFAAGHPGARPGAYAALQVFDNGLGMDEETLSRVFDAFFTTKPSGTGLGLASVYQTVKRSGGYIWAESEPGQGATFTLYLPRHTAQQRDSKSAGAYFSASAAAPGG